MVVATSLRDEVSKLVELYRIRWQVVVLLKRLRSVIKFELIPTRNEMSSQAWLNGKLLIAALCEALTNINFYPRGNTERTRSVWGEMRFTKDIISFVVLLYNRFHLFLDNLSLLTYICSQSPRARPSAYDRFLANTA